MIRPLCLVPFCLAVVGSFSPAVSALGQGLEVPRAQDRPPGPALSPEEAVKKMTVPEGFHVEIVAAEPDVVNPVAMCIDEKGRFWVTESFEYPRREPGPGRDRIKVLEDTDGDGRVDKVTIFAEGLNIPSGIAVGHGGVWVGNAPDLLFLRDTDGDLKADRTEVVVTGFGRDDTHELPNSFTWGPDGWLYGLNGVFNVSRITYGPENPNFKPNQPPREFTCALWRIHPQTREFQVFAEGTSNPWGIAINERGDFFVSACVIDHLWHLANNGYYVRQGGPYPPHTWPIESIVEHGHQKAAYCGITWFDSDAYPDQYRRVLFMGNIHGNCINADVLESNGSTYKGKPHPGFTPSPGAWDNDQYGEIRKRGSDRAPKLADLLTANDPWFMPVVQKTGPDGCLYILDWYDRYHCYQDANADPAGVDRGRGRLYRLRYKQSRRVKPFDLASRSDQELIELLGNANVFYRETAQRLLAERASPALEKALLELATGDSQEPTVQQRHATFALMSLNLSRDDRFLSVARALIACPDAFRRSWAIRCLMNHLSWMERTELIEMAMFELVTAALEDPSPAVRLQGVTFVGRLSEQGASYVAYDEALVDVLAKSSNDALIPNAVWVALKAYLARLPSQARVELFARSDEVLAHEGGREVVERLLQWVNDQHRYDLARRMIDELANREGAGPLVAAEGLQSLAAAVQSGGIKDHDRGNLIQEFGSLVEKRIADNEDGPIDAAMLELAASWGDPQAVAAIEKLLGDAPEDGEALAGLRALVSSGDEGATRWATRLLDNPSPEFQGQVLFSMSRIEDPQIAEAVLARYAQLSPEVQPRALELLTQRPQWSKPLLAAIAQQTINKDSLNLNQLRRVASFHDEALNAQFHELYGTLREGRNPDREHVVNQTRDFLYGNPGDPMAGQAVFKKVCAQCHKIYGEGAEVGPDITSNGRNNWEQLLSNVLDPSLVIGNAYQARVLATADGRVLTGLPVEETDQHVILKVQGGKLETIPRDEIDAYRVSDQSLMPEQLEKQLSPQEMADLFAFLALDKPPGDKSGRRLPGAPRTKKR